jgi:hypothetical protein
MPSTRRPRRRRTRAAPDAPERWLLCTRQARNAERCVEQLRLQRLEWSVSRARLNGAIAQEEVAVSPPVLLFERFLEHV